MEEIYEFRIDEDYAGILLSEHEGVKQGIARVIQIRKADPLFFKIKETNELVQKKYDTLFFYGWEIIRKYSKKEIDEAEYFLMKIDKTFEPAGEECGTIYDESKACKICGVNASIKGDLILKYSSIPNKDIARTIADEIIVSEKFVKVFENKKLKGADFSSVYFKKKKSHSWYNLTAHSPAVNLSQKTVAGVNPFDLSESSESIKNKNVSNTLEIYKCPLGHTIGLNLLSEVFIKRESIIGYNDISIAKEKTGVRRGLLRPDSIFIISKKLKSVIEKDNLKGFSFEVANIVD